MIDYSRIFISDYPEGANLALDKLRHILTQQMDKFYEGRTYSAPAADFETTFGLTGISGNINRKPPERWKMPDGYDEPALEREILYLRGLTSLAMIRNIIESDNALSELNKHCESLHKDLVAYAKQHFLAICEDLREANSPDLDELYQYVTKDDGMHTDQYLRVLVAFVMGVTSQFNRDDIKFHIRGGPSTSDSLHSSKHSLAVTNATRFAIDKGIMAPGRYSHYETDTLYKLQWSVSAPTLDEINRQFAALRASSPLTGLEDVSGTGMQGTGTGTPSAPPQPKGI